MKISFRLFCSLLFVLCVSGVALWHTATQSSGGRQLYVCRSPLLAFAFWNSLKEIGRKGVTITPAIAKRVCDGMNTGGVPQCVSIRGEHLTPVVTGAGGAMSMSDGTTTIWFHNPNEGGWIHPEYYVQFLHAK